MKFQTLVDLYVAYARLAPHDEGLLEEVELALEAEVGGLQLLAPPLQLPASDLTAVCTHNKKQ